MSMVMGTKTPSTEDFLPRLKNNSSAHEMETIPPDIKLVFQSLFNINTSTIRILIAKGTIN